MLTTYNCGGTPVVMRETGDKGKVPIGFILGAILGGIIYAFLDRPFNLGAFVGGMNGAILGGIIVVFLGAPFIIGGNNGGIIGGIRGWRR